MLAKNFFKTIFIFSCSSLITLIGCSSTKDLASNWDQPQIKVDGDVSDWGNKLQYFEDKKVAVGFVNNDSSLYVCLTTTDMSVVMPMFRSGLIIWFEPEGEGKTFGIKYPLFNMMDMGNQNHEFGEGDFTLGNENGSPDGRTRGDFIKRMLERQNDIQILNEDKFPLTLIGLKNNDGIEAKLAYNNDQFVYELKVPLINKDNKYSYAVSTRPGEKLEVKFETGQPDRKNFTGMREGGMGPQGGGEEPGEGGMGRRGGGRRMGGMNRGGSSPELLDLSVELTLRSTP
jgi:hypothetical protein